MHEWTLRLGLSLIVAIGIRTGPCVAQPVTPAPRPQAVYPPMQAGPLLVPLVPYEPAYHPPFPPAIAPPWQAPLANTHLQRTLNKHGMACENNYWGACSSFHFNMNFAFGSCRDFFGDRCIPGQPCFSKHAPR